MQLLLRRATPDALEEVAEVFARAREAMFAYIPRLHTAEEDRAFLGGLLAATEVWVAEDSRGRVVGFVSRVPAASTCWSSSATRARGASTSGTAATEEREPDARYEWRP